jgi:hypothetical protein
MSHSTFYAPMTRIYDKRVLGMAPLWMWRYVDRVVIAPGYQVVLVAEWTNPKTKHLWGLSFDARTVYRTLDVEDAIAARNELHGMIHAARLLAGKS